MKYRRAAPRIHVFGSFHSGVRRNEIQTAAPRIHVFGSFHSGVRRNEIDQQRHVFTYLGHFIVV